MRLQPGVGERAPDLRTLHVAADRSGQWHAAAADNRGRAPARGVHRRAAAAPADGPEDRLPIERCISASPIKVGFVQTRNNSYYQIVQTGDTTLLYTEMMRDARLIHMDGRPHPPVSIRSWAGDSRGRWE